MSAPCSRCGRFLFAELTVCYWCRTPEERAAPAPPAVEPQGRIDLTVPPAQGKLL